MKSSLCPSVKSYLPVRNFFYIGSVFKPWKTNRQSYFHIYNINISYIIYYYRFICTKTNKDIGISFILLISRLVLYIEVSSLLIHNPGFYFGSGHRIMWSGKMPITFQNLIYYVLSLFRSYLTRGRRWKNLVSTRRLKLSMCNSSRFRRWSYHLPRSSSSSTRKSP